ncbi:MAG: SIMPL domain-containing protein [Clostridiales bacterium]|jgi:uncharacterized protein YggE|nr:SIMPL domain-containing protein [Clostridiales bacterium]
MQGKKRLLKASLLAAMGLITCSVAGCGSGKTPTANGAEVPVEGPAAVEVSAALRADAGKITVNGNGSVKIKPDIAYLNLGVTTQNKDAKVAQAENSEQMNNILEALKNAGIEEKDIQTSDYSIYPQQDYQSGNGKYTIIGYTVNNSIQVKVRAIDQTGAILEAAVDAGANAGGGIQFSVADSTAAYQQALDLAIQDAVSKAGAIGKSLNAAVGSPVEITEMGNYAAPVLYGNADMKIAGESATGAVPVQSGDLSISASIQAVFPY